MLVLGILHLVVLKTNKFYKNFGSRDGSGIHQQVLEEFKFNM